MRKIGITGSLASGKTTACKILANKGPLFSADLAVKKLYKKKIFKILIAKKLKIKNPENLKKIIKDKTITMIMKICRLLKAENSKELLLIGKTKFFANSYISKTIKLF